MHSTTSLSRAGTCCVWDVSVLLVLSGSLLVQNETVQKKYKETLRPHHSNTKSVWIYRKRTDCSKLEKETFWCTSDTEDISKVWSFCYTATHARLQVYCITHLSDLCNLAERVNLNYTINILHHAKCCISSRSL